MRFARNGKWQWTFYSAAAALLVMAAFWIGWTALNEKSPDAGWWTGWAALFLLANASVAYVMSRRTGKRIDQLQLALKRAAAGNWSVRLPALPGDVFEETFAEFNGMLQKLEANMKLLRRLGEREVLDEVPALEAAVLEERRRLARDLHDTVSQQLFALHMSASSLPKLLELDAEQAKRLMEQLIVMSASAQKQMRGLIAQLRPMELQGRSLTEALDRWFPDYCRQNGLQGTLELQEGVPLTEATEHQLFLIIQEAMANVVKHAGASSVSLALGETDSYISLRIEDDGEGFRAERIRQGAYGLSTMRERAQKLGGDAEIVTKPGAGTRVRVLLPKPDVEPDAEPAPNHEPELEPDSQERSPKKR